MRKEWSALRVTFILYFAILIIPVNIFFFYSLVESSKEDTDVVRQIGEIGSTIQRLALLDAYDENVALVNRVDEAMDEIKPWFSRQEQIEYNIRARTPAEQFEGLVGCWHQFKRSLEGHAEHMTTMQHAAACWDKSQSLLFVTGKISDLKKNTTINMIYFSLTLSMLMLVALVYLVRVYIHLQEKKHAVYDLETKLFNRQYFDAELKKFCAESLRHTHSLSVLCFRIENFALQEKNRDKQHLSTKVGGIFNANVRESDTAARCTLDAFALILPETDQEGAGILRSRLEEKLASEDLNFQTMLFTNDEKECSIFEAEIEHYLRA
ncbi:GGDEF domain-containing protein [Sulfurimonas sp. HSL-1656]|uniref:GGDEF domain-containing protein n=1 Tax=Thiomicrolovo subterrani TaxID=3131934 RepID=UPI0031F9F123